jgi:threonine dehydrogenase-like Zn-dependent dehydrogenase
MRAFAGSLRGQARILRKVKGVVLVEPRKVEVRDIPDADIKESTDVLMRVTSTAIGSGLQVIRTKAITRARKRNW